MVGYATWNKNGRWNISDVWTRVSEKWSYSASESFWRSLVGLPSCFLFSINLALFQVGWQNFFAANRNWLLKSIDKCAYIVLFPWNWKCSTFICFCARIVWSKWWCFRAYIEIAFSVNSSSWWLILKKNFDGCLKKCPCLFWSSSK